MRLGLGLGINRGRKSSGESFILDTVGDAEVAFSLRQLSSTFTGDVIVVRRSSDNATEGFTPSEIIDGTLTSFTGAGNGFITTWYDQSGNGNNLTQGTASSQPQIVSSGALITEGGLPVVRFDGTNDQLNLGTQISSGGVGTNRPFSIFYVYKSNRVSSEDYVVFGDAGAGRIRLYTNIYRMYISSLTYDATTNNDNFGTRYLWTNILESEALSYFRNGSQDGFLTGTPNAGTGIQDPLLIDNIGYGTTRPTHGDMQEFIFYATGQTSNREVIETNINTYYSIY